MAEKVFVVGVGMTKFEKPGSRDWDYPDMVKEAGTKALDDAGVKYEDRSAAPTQPDQTGRPSAMAIKENGLPAKPTTKPKQ